MPPRLSCAIHAPIVLVARLVALVSTCLPALHSCFPLVVSFHHAFLPKLKEKLRPGSIHPSLLLFELLVPRCNLVNDGDRLLR